MDLCGKLTWTLVVGVLDPVDMDMAAGGHGHSGDRMLWHMDMHHVIIIHITRD